MRNLLFKSVVNSPLTEAAPQADDPEIEALAAELDHAARSRLGRSLSIREVDAGSCNGCELEVNALGNSYYDLERFGLRFVASPRHADVLLVTGPVARLPRVGRRRRAGRCPHQGLPADAGAVAARIVGAANAGIGRGSAFRPA